MNRTCITALLMLALAVNLPTAHATLARPDVSGLQTISPSSLQYILRQCQSAWPQFTYGNLRSAYNHGTLTIVSTVKPDGVYNDVTFGGITLCVIESI